MRGRLLFAAFALLCLISCSSHRGEPLSRPLRIDSETLASGQKAFMYYCEKCHPGGDKGVGLSLINKPLPAFMIKSQVRRGMGAMPSFSKDLLPDNKLDDIVLYIKAMRNREER